MTKRIVQFIATLLILVLHIGGLLNLYASVATVQKPSFVLQNRQFHLANHTIVDKTDGKLQLHRGKSSLHHIDEGAYEKVEESDSNRLAESNFPAPLFTDLLQQTITFSLYSILYNNKQLSESTEFLTTCFDGEKFILYQDFRI